MGKRGCRLINFPTRPKFLNFLREDSYLKRAQKNYFKLKNAFILKEKKPQNII